LPSERWRFVGFLPRRRNELERLLLGTTETLVAFESPKRLVATLTLLAGSDPERPVAVCRELTKIHEEVRRGPAAKLAAHYGAEPPRGEVVLVVAAAPPGAQPDTEERALATLRAVVAAGARPRPAAKALAELTGVPANRLYRALTDDGGR
jgi:16S rRNA (cytidine1402-2'-O)-methyltransferase